MGKYDYIKVATVSPKVSPGNPLKNKDEIIRLIKETRADIVLFPELCIPGYSLGDFIYNQDLLNDTKRALFEIIKSVDLEVVIIGSIFEYQGSLYNCAFVIQQGELIGIVPKKYLPRSKEFYEPRYFASGEKLCNELDYINFNGRKVPVGDIIFKDKNGQVNFGIEICGDMWSVDAPHHKLYASGAEVVFNLSASPYEALKQEERRIICSCASMTGEGVYVYCSSSTSESTSSTIFERVHLVYELGEKVIEKDDFSLNSEVTKFDIDIARIRNKRFQTGYLHDVESQNYKTGTCSLWTFEEYSVDRFIDPTPYRTIVMKDYKMIFEALVQAVVKRCEVAKPEKLLLGVSGGLDSTLTLLILKEVERRLNKDMVIGVILPSLATSKKTLNRCHKLLEAFNVKSEVYDLKKIVKDELNLIKHDGFEDIVYENAQARFRTQILLNLANKYNGLMIGTSDLSEIALGFETFGGDHISNYNAISGVPKTAVKALLECYALEHPEYKSILSDVLKAPITPELTKEQDTEEIVGSYEVNDFVMYHVLGYGAKKERVYSMMEKLYPEYFPDFYYDNFVKKLKKYQFKRLSAPEGVKIFDISLSSAVYQLNGDAE